MDRESVSGDLLDVGMELLDRFVSKVDAVNPEECWEWTAYVDHAGYGRIGIGGSGKSGYAHRVSYELLVGPIPEGLQIDHLCRNRTCVNPDHLEPVTQRENILRGQGTGAQYARRTHCSQGHEFTPENTYVKQKANGGIQRSCRACWRSTWHKRSTA